MAIIYSKIADAVASLYGNNTNLPTASDSEVLYTKNNGLYTISHANVRKYKDFRTTGKLMFAKNSGDVTLPDQQINVWVKKTDADEYVLVIGEETKSNVEFTLASTASYAVTKPFTYNDTDKTAITITSNKAEAINGEVVFNFTHTASKTMQLLVNGVVTEFTDVNNACTATFTIDKDTTVEVKDITTP